jgi:hypothetical protein
MEVKLELFLGRIAQLMLHRTIRYAKFSSSSMIPMSLESR